ncbi:MAG: M28 family peptidase [Candidatus Promineifilaceae bacterium]
MTRRSFPLVLALSLLAVLIFVLQPVTASLPHDPLADFPLAPQPSAPLPINPHPLPDNFHYPTVLDPDPVIQGMINQVISSTVMQYDGGLSGQWPVTIGGQSYTLTTRHTYSGEPIQKATQYVGEHMAGLGMAVEYHTWNAVRPPNVIGQMTGAANPDDIYIIGAHLDDMPSGTTAPGADDNASGSTAVMIAADILSQYQWDCTLRFVFFTGEEQGLLGSAAYASRAFSNGETILGVLNLDMIAWNTLNSSPDIDIHASQSVAGSVPLAQLFTDVVDVYNLNLIPQIIPNGTGASDHASFWSYGYPAILAIEDYRNAAGSGTGDFNPYYHTTQDNLAHVDVVYFTELVRAAVGAFAHMNGCLAGASGTVMGTVTDENATPLPSANVQMVGNGSIFHSMANGAGQYTATLPIGVYTMTASVTGFTPVTVTNVIIVTDTVTTVDFMLPPTVVYEPNYLPFMLSPTE